MFSASFHFSFFSFINLPVRLSVYSSLRVFSIFHLMYLCILQAIFGREASFNATFFVQRTPKFHRIGRNLAIYRDRILCTMSYEWIFSPVKRTVFWRWSRDGALIEPNARIHALTSWLLIIRTRTQTLVNQVHLENKVISKLLRLHQQLLKITVSCNRDFDNKIATSATKRSFPFGAYSPRLPIRHVRRGRLSLGSLLLSFLGEKKVVRHVASFYRLFITGERFIFSWFYTLFRDTVDASRGCIHGVLNIEW